MLTTGMQSLLSSDPGHNAEARAIQMKVCFAEAVLTMTHHASLIFNRSHALSLPVTHSND